jgi:putative membrane protein
MKHLLKLILSAIASLATIAWLLPNVSYSTLGILVITALVLVLVQVIIKPIISLLLLPLTIITLGLFSGVITVILFWLAINIVPGFHIDPLIINGYHLGVWLTLIVVGIAVSWLESLYYKLLSLFLG